MGGFVKISELSDGDRVKLHQYLKQLLGTEHASALVTDFTTAAEIQ